MTQLRQNYAGLCPGDESKRLTKRLLKAMDAAVGAMLAGMEGEGDWPDDLPRRDLEDAEEWVGTQLAKREAQRG